ncbi:MAG: YfiR family protein [Sphingobacteriales bacterium]|nr:MAG: YfiR family protein [Sphingobacteriales bacterium]
MQNGVAFRTLRRSFVQRKLRRLLMIGLAMVRNRMQFFINQGRAKAAQLSISSRLLRLAKISN